MSNVRRHMKTIASATTLFLAASIASAAEPEVLLLNGTITDITTEATPLRPAIEIAPNQGSLVAIAQFEWLRFGQEAHRYGISRLARHAKSGAAPAVVQAHTNGCLYLLRPESKSPTRTMPKQPAGFPVCPSKRIDLT